MWLFFSIWDLNSLSVHIFLKLLIVQNEVCHSPEYHALIEAPIAHGVFYDTCMHIPSTQHTWPRRPTCDPNPVFSTLFVLQPNPICSLLTVVISSPSWHDWCLCLPPDTCAWATGSHPPPGACWQSSLQWWDCGQRFLLGKGMSPWGWGASWSWGDRIVQQWAQVLSLHLLLPSRCPSSSVMIASAINCPRWWMLL